jgi:putative endonuclease
LRTWRNWQTCLPAGRRAGDMYFVYALKSLKSNYIYKGMTKDIESRLRRHNSGLEKTTRSYRPFRLILLERFNSRNKARKREKYLKSGSGREFLKQFADVAELADAQP